MNSIQPSKTREHYRQYERLIWIDREIRAKKYPNNRQIAEKFETSQKTAQRMIEFMRERLLAPLEYSAEKRGWYYSREDFTFLPMIEMSEAELLSMLIAEKLVRQYRGLAIGRHIEEAFGKILNSFSDIISVDLSALSEAHSFEAAPTTKLDWDTLHKLGRAVSRSLTIEMTYFIATRGVTDHRIVDPLHLRNSGGEWYLIAWDHKRKAARDFLISRIRELTVTNTKFSWPEGVDIEKELASGFGMIRGSEPIEVEIIFDEYQARWIRERSRFHPTEDRVEMPDGRLKLKMTVTALDGVKRFVMQYGSHAEVIKPEELRQSIREELEAMHSIYRT